MKKEEVRSSKSLCHKLFEKQKVPSFQVVSFVFNTIFVGCQKNVEEFFDKIYKNIDLRIKIKYNVKNKGKRWKL